MRLQHGSGGGAEEAGGGGREAMAEAASQEANRQGHCRKSKRYAWLVALAPSTCGSRGLPESRRSYAGRLTLIKPSTTHTPCHVQRWIPCYSSPTAAYSMCCSSSTPAAWWLCSRPAHTSPGENRPPGYPWWSTSPVPKCSSCAAPSRMLPASGGHCRSITASMRRRWRPGPCGRAAREGPGAHQRALGSWCPQRRCLCHMHVHTATRRRR